MFSFNAILYLSGTLAAIGFLLASIAFLIWAVLGQRGATRMRRLRIALGSVLLFLAAVGSVASLDWLGVRTDVMRAIRPDFEPPFHRWSQALSILGPVMIFMTAVLLIRAFYRDRPARKRLYWGALSCLLVFLVASAVNYHLLYSIQVPAFERYVAIESREWKTRVGEPAPDFQVVALDGSPVQSSDLRGKVVLINFFATWCGPCLIELPHLHKLWSELEANEGLCMLVIGREETVDTVAAFKSKNGFTFPMAVDPDASAYHRFAEKGIPRTYLVGRDGKILYQSIGFADTDFYHRELATLRRTIETELAAVR